MKRHSSARGSTPPGYIDISRLAQTAIDDIRRVPNGRNALQPKQDCSGMKMRHIGYGILTVCSFVALGAGGLSASAADQDDRSPAFRQCVRNSGGATATMRACMASEYRRLDRAMNAAYRDALRRSPDAAARLRVRDAQRTWLHNRVAVCRTEVERSGMAGGTGGLLIEDNCRLRLLSERTTTLERQP